MLNTVVFTKRKKACRKNGRPSVCWILPHGDADSRLSNHELRHHHAENKILLISVKKLHYVGKCRKILSIQQIFWTNFSISRYFSPLGIKIFIWQAYKSTNYVYIWGPKSHASNHSDPSGPHRLHRLCHRAYKKGSACPIRPLRRMHGLPSAWGTAGKGWLSAQDGALPAEKRVCRWRAVPSGKVRLKKKHQKIWQYGIKAVSLHRKTNRYLGWAA